MGNPMNFASIPCYEICMDENRAENITGRMYCGVKPEGIPFEGVEKLVFEMERIMDNIKFPEAAMKKRSFAEKKNIQRTPYHVLLENQEEMRKFSFTAQAGKIATVAVQIQFRQNASWQGFAKWLEREETFSFESELEFIRILDAVANK